MTTDCTHEWRAFDEDEMTDLRSKTRTGRPPMAFVGKAEQCTRCGAVEATVGWYGQGYRVPYAPKEAGGTSVMHWPTRGSATGSSAGNMST